MATLVEIREIQRLFIYKNIVSWNTAKSTTAVISVTVNFEFWGK